MLAFGGTNSGIFKLLMVLHILSAIVGIGGVVLNGLYAAQAQKRQGPTGRAVSEANYAVTQVAEYIIYLVPVFGILLVLASDKGVSFGDTFVWLSLVLFAIAIGISHSVLIPSHRKINSLLLEMEQGPSPVGGPPPQVAQIQTLGQRQGGAGAVMDILLVAILSLMIWQPR